MGTDSDRVGDLAQWMRGWQAEPDSAGVLARLVEAAQAVVPGVESAAVTLLGRDGATTPAYTDELVQQVDGWQRATAQGPCLEAAAGASVVRSDELEWDARWPDFSPRAVELGVASVLSLQLDGQLGQPGALNVYAVRAGAFDSSTERLAGLLVAQAELVLASKHSEVNLRAALKSREVIGQAQGRLMERYGLTAQEAFERLVKASQDTNIKLRDVAAKLASPSGSDLLI